VAAELGGARHAGAWALCLLSCLSSCSAPIAANLDESDANQAVVVLERGSVGASKERDPEHEGRFVVSVANQDASTAIALLARENLPPRPSPGVLEALGESSVVPSRLAEHAKWSAGIAGDLERSLRGVDGVLSARVHLGVPPAERLDPEGASEKPTAAVLIRHRGATPPVAAGEVQRLVGGAVPGLAPERVNVVMVTSAWTETPEGSLLRLGPVSVTRGSVGALRLIVVAIAVLALGLLGSVLALWTRLRRTEMALFRAPAAAAAKTRSD
jgi:type III secretion protein J